MKLFSSQWRNEFRNIWYIAPNNDILSPVRSTARSKVNYWYCETNQAQNSLWKINECHVFGGRRTIYTSKTIFSNWLIVVVGDLLQNKTFPMLSYPILLHPLLHVTVKYPSIGQPQWYLFKIALLFVLVSW